MSGYFAPLDNQVPKGGRAGAPPVYTVPFHDQPALLLKNTPDEYITKMSPGTIIPRFFLAAGADDAQDVQAARASGRSSSSTRPRSRWTWCPTPHTTPAPGAGRNARCSAG